MTLTFLLCLALFLLNSASAEFSIESVYLASDRYSNNGFYYDFSEGTTQNTLNITWTDPSLGEPIDILSSIEIYLNDILVAVAYALPEESECYFPYDQECQFILDKANHQGILFIPHDPMDFEKYLGLYTVKIKSFEEHENAFEFQMKAIKYCDKIVELSIDDIDDEQCRVVLSGSGCDSPITHEPNISVRFEDSLSDAIGWDSVEYMRTDVDENGLFRYLPRPESSDLQVDDFTPIKPLLVYRYQEAPENPMLLSSISLSSMFEGSGCPDMYTYCSGQAGDKLPPFPFPADFDFSLVCYMQNYKLISSKCRSRSIQAVNATIPATLTFLCPADCSLDHWTGEGDSIEEFHKTLVCDEDKKIWQETGNQNGRWPVCYCPGDK